MILSKLPTSLQDDKHPLFIKNKEAIKNLEIHLSRLNQFLPNWKQIEILNKEQKQIDIVIQIVLSEQETTNMLDLIEKTDGAKPNYPIKFNHNTFSLVWDDNENLDEQINQYVTNQNITFQEKNTQNMREIAFLLEMIEQEYHKKWSKEITDYLTKKLPLEKDNFKIDHVLDCIEEIMNQYNSMLIEKTNISNNEKLLLQAFPVFDGSKYTFKQNNKEKMIFHCLTELNGEKHEYEMNINRSLKLHGTLDSKNHLFYLTWLPDIHFSQNGKNIPHHSALGELLFNDEENQQ